MSIERGDILDHKVPRSHNVGNFCASRLKRFILFVLQYTNNEYLDKKGLSESDNHIILEATEVRTKFLSAREHA